MLERLDGVDDVEGVVVELREQRFHLAGEEGSRLDEPRVLLGHHLEGLVVDVDPGEVREAVGTEVFEVSTGATADLEDPRVRVRVVGEDVDERLADLVRTDFGVVGGRVLPGALGPALAHVLRVHGLDWGGERQEGRGIVVFGLG